MQMPNVPERIDRARLTAALAELGIETDKLKSVTFGGNSAEFVYLRTRDNETHVLGSDVSIALITTSARIA